MKGRWLHQLFELIALASTKAARRDKRRLRPRPSRFRPMAEVLEPRLAPAVNLSIAAPAPFPEGDSGTTNMIFVVTRSGDLAPGVTVDFTTRDGSAVAGVDYQARSGTLSFASNQTTATIAVPIIGNTLPQPNRTFTVELSSPLLRAAFAGPQPFATGTSPRSLVAADLNGDGKLDLTVANEGASSVSVLLNTAAPGATAPTFAAQQSFATGSIPFSVAVADLNGDGKPDLAVTNAGTSTSPGSTVSVLLNMTAPGAATPTFATQQTFAPGGRPFSVAVADLNGDGKPDLAVTDAGTPASPGSTVSVLLNTTAPGTAPTFAVPVTFATGSFPFSVAVGDLNGDGKPDLAVTNSGTNASPGSTVSVLLNTTVGTTFGFANQQAFATGTRPRFVAVGDLNGDGRLDLAVTGSSGPNRLSVLLNTTAPGPRSWG